MKDITKGKFTRDPLAEIKKDPHFSIYSAEESMKIRLAVEIYNARRSIGASQKDLAKAVFTTQRLISNIENADINVGMNLLGRIVRFLNFNSEVLAGIFNTPFSFYTTQLSISGNGSQNQDNNSNLSKQVQCINSTSTTNLIN